MRFVGGVQGVTCEQGVQEDMKMAWQKDASCEFGSGPDLQVQPLGLGCRNGCRLTTSSGSAILGRMSQNGYGGGFSFVDWHKTGRQETAMTEDSLGMVLAGLNIRIS